MPILASFSLPAFIQDFTPDSPDDLALKSLWNINVSGWIQQAMPSPPSFFYDPTQVDIPAGSPSVLVHWGAFPGRLDQYYSKNPPNQPANPHPLTQEQIYSLADTGYYAEAGGQKLSFPQIPSVICPVADWNEPLKDFGPYGPRGWLDEYCEWSAARDLNGKLVRVDFACENPEYWNSLWKISPERVRELYESTLNYDAPAARHIAVKLEDLQLFVADPVTQQPTVVIDPDTGRPAYNPLNKWNSGPVAVRTGAAASFAGGVMHLTSTPNTLQTELGLAGAATLQYQPAGGTGNSDPQALICCGDYGQEYRHSDPHIGQSVNQVVGGQALGAPQTVCLANPVGLYLQGLTNVNAFSFAATIDPTRLPAGAKASDVWQVVRGSATLLDPVTGKNFPGSLILHAICQIPSAWLAVYPAMTLADILINNVAITFAGQIANQFEVGLYARPLATPNTPPAAPCASGIAVPGQPLQCMFSVLWEAYYSLQELAPTGVSMSMASNTTMIAPQLRPGSGAQRLTLTCVTPSGTPKVAFLLPDGSGPDTSIGVELLGSAPVTYAVPGNSFPGTYAALSLAVTIPAGAKGGLRSVQITDPVAGANSLPATIYIVPAE